MLDTINVGQFSVYTNGSRQCVYNSLVYIMTNLYVFMQKKCDFIVILISYD